jgi:hypothetical protein
MQVGWKRTESVGPMKESFYNIYHIRIYFECSKGAKPRPWIFRLKMSLFKELFILKQK